MADVEVLLGEVFLQDHGDEEMTRKVFVPGEDHSQELAQTEQSLERLRWESDNGLVDDEALYRSRLSALVARKAELTANTVVPARWDEVGIGKTYRELWDDETTDRRDVLRASKIRLILEFPPHGSTTQTLIPWHYEDLSGREVTPKFHGPYTDDLVTHEFLWPPPKV